MCPDMATLDNKLAAGRSGDGGGDGDDQSEGDEAAELAAAAEQMDTVKSELGGRGMGLDLELKDLLATRQEEFIHPALVGGGHSSFRCFLNEQ
jgi:hypothetical protein